MKARRPAALPWGREATAALAALAPGDVAIVCAGPGGGKTRVTKQAQAAWRRSVVFDPFGRRDRLNASRGELHRRPWEGVLVTPLELCRKPSLLDRDPLRLVVAPEAFEKEGLAAAYGAVSRLAWHTGGLVLVGEEAGLYGRSSLDAILRVAAGGAHAGLALVLICQSLGRVPLDGRRHASVIVAGPQGEVNDLEDLRKRCGTDFARRVRGLKKGDSPLAWRVGDSL